MGGGRGARREHGGARAGVGQRVALELVQVLQVDQPRAVRADPLHHRAGVEPVLALAQLARDRAAVAGQRGAGHERVRADRARELLRAARAVADALTAARADARARAAGLVRYLHDGPELNNLFYNGGQIVVNILFWLREYTPAFVFAPGSRNLTVDGVSDDEFAAESSLRV